MLLYCSESDSALLANVAITWVSSVARGFYFCILIGRLAMRPVGVLLVGLLCGCWDGASAAEVIPFRAPLTHLASIRSVNCPVACYCSATTWNCDGANLPCCPPGTPRRSCTSTCTTTGSKTSRLPCSEIFCCCGPLTSEHLADRAVQAFSDLPSLHTVFLSQTD